MVRLNIVKIVFILVLFLGMFVFSQEKQVNEDKDKKLRKEILAVYKSKGEKGLRYFVKEKKDKIASKFIIDFAKAGMKERKGEWLRVCEFMAEEKRDEKALAEVYYKMGEYYRSISKNKNAANYFDKALPIFIKLNDLVGQGNIYLSRGDIYSIDGKHSKALVMFNLALPFFEKTGELIGQGNVYGSKGDIYYSTGKYSKALETYDKSLSFHEKAENSIGQGNMYIKKGKVYFNLGNNSKALKMYDKSLLFFEKDRNPVGLGTVYLRKGDIFLRIGDTSKAIEMYDKALPFLEKAGNIIGQGNVYKRMGDIDFFIGNNSKAFDLYEKALTFYEKAGAPVSQGNMYIRKGKVYFKDGKNSKALEMYDKALLFFEKVGEPIGQGNVYWRKGEIYYKAGNNSKALEMYNKALPFFEKVGVPINQGNVYWRKGDIYYQAGNNSKALEMYDKALPFFEKAEEPSGQGNVYFRKGVIYYSIGDNSKALEMYDKSLPFFKKLKFHLGQADLYYRKGEIYSRTGDNSKSLDMYDKALPFFEKAKFLNGQGNVYLRKGDIYGIKGDNSKAMKMLDKALFFFEKTGKPLGQGNVYNAKGDIYLSRGENSKAFEMYDKALTFFEKAGNPLGQGNIYMAKSRLYYYINNYLKAIEMNSKALYFYETAQNIGGQGNVFLGKGIIYFVTGNNSKASEKFAKALYFFEKVGDIIGKANVFRGMGLIYFNDKEYSKSLEMYKKSNFLYEKAGDIIGKANIYMKIGDIYFRTDNKSTAFEMYDKALYFAQKAGTIEGQSNAYRGMGDIYFFTKDNSNALEMYNKALLKNMVDTEPTANTFHAKAKVLIKLGKKGRALPLFEKGIAILEKVRTKTGITEMKRTFIERVYYQYEETVLFFLENKYYEKGFKYAESMKTRVFLDRMGEELVPLEKGFKPELREERDKLVAKFSLITKKIHETGGEEKKKLQQLKDEYRQVESKFEELLIKIRLENPLYASVRYPQPISVQSLQNEVLKKGEILVRYFISPEKLYVFLVSKKKFKVVPLDVKKEEIKGLVEEYLSSIKENDTSRMIRYGKILYEKLFKPLEKRIKKSKDIIIVPDRELATIPFESFIVDNKGQAPPVFLLEKYRVKYLQSASLLKILRQHYQNNRDTNSFIGFGDPVYDYENFKLGKPEKGSMKILATESTEGTEDEIREIHRSRYARAGGIMDRLQASGEEVKTIARLFEKESQKSVIYLREEATEDNAGSPGMKDFDYIHFTCHGLLNDDFQSLVLSQLPPDKSKEDGYFTLNEIMNCDYNAKLVVLSACQTGSGKLERAEGVTGMTRAVIYSGTPAVAASLWKVDDEATKELMVKFYQNMLEKNLDKAEALRQAKLELIKNKKYRSPLFWSAFVMYGE